MCIIKIKSRNQDSAGSPFYRSAVAFCQNVKDFSFRGCSIRRFLGRIFWAIRAYGYTPRWGLTTAVISGTPRHLDSPTSCQAKINKSKINAFYMVPIVDVFFCFLCCCNQRRASWHKNVIINTSTKPKIEKRTRKGKEQAAAMNLGQSNCFIFCLCFSTLCSFSWRS